ncbi:hypothetical protein P154DRAFT_611342 [Amniculicola lignicola CBS 123094]|uniref:Uncharacterized protein n=1 Tax=Amniculicola lignicola CBS 123094 TaxID=1392246 RepID=A0A6A5WC85_9PLEO|nr:hypothetical protein P154DRAFT_611342 [Amniculicola lignicola CBS 123094]
MSHPYSMSSIPGSLTSSLLRHIFHHSVSALQQYITIKPQPGNKKQENEDKELSRRTPCMIIKKTSIGIGAVTLAKSSTMFFAPLEHKNSMNLSNGSYINKPEMNYQAANLALAKNTPSSIKNTEAYQKFEFVQKAFQRHADILLMNINNIENWDEQLWACLSGSKRRYIHEDVKKTTDATQACIYECHKKHSEWYVAEYWKSLINDVRFLEPQLKIAGFISEILRARATVLEQHISGLVSVWADWRKLDEFGSPMDFLNEMKWKVTPAIHTWGKSYFNTETFGGLPDYVWHSHDQIELGLKGALQQRDEKDPSSKFKDSFPHCPRGGLDERWACGGKISTTYTMTTFANLLECTDLGKIFSVSERRWKTFARPPK